MSSSDSTGGSGRAAEDAIHQELRAARKRPGGLSPQTMRSCATYSATATPKSPWWS